MRKPLLLLFAGVAVAAAVSAYHYVEKSNDQPVFRLAPMEKGRLMSAVTSSGTLNAVITVQVGSQVSGQIEELLADFNSEVREGQIIARIDPENFEARVRQAEAELDVAQANVSIQQAAVIRSRAELENAQASLAAARAQAEKAKVAVEDARRDLDRKQTLHKNNIISKSEIDKAMATYDQALAQYQTSLSDERAQASLVNSRKASLKMAEEQVVHALAQVKHREAVLHQNKVDLEHTIIRSPVNGVVIERSVDMGQTVAASLQAPTLFTIAQDLRKMQVETAIDEADIGRIRVGQRVIFTVDAFPGHEFHGRVEKIRMAPQTLQNVVTYTVVVSAENPDLRLLPGMTANAKVVVEERAEALKVSNAALRFKPTGKGNHEAVPLSNLGAVNDLSDHSGIPQEKLERLVQALKLDENQQAQVSAIFAEVRKRITAMREYGASTEEIRSEIHSIRLKSREAIRRVLSPEQQMRFDELTASRPPKLAGATPGQVWVLGPEGKPQWVEVRSGITDGSFTEIVQGDLKPDQQVIIGYLSAGKSSGRSK